MYCKRLLLLSLLLFNYSIVFSEDVKEKILPIWQAPWEIPLPEEEWFDNPNRDAPPVGSRLPAEYEPAQAVVIGWEAFTTMLTEIAQDSYLAGAEVWCAGSSAPSSITGVPGTHYQRINSCSLDTVWMRDYGPFGILMPGGDLAIVDSRYRHYQYRIYDDALPCCLAGVQSLNCYSINTAGSGNEWLIIDGGNIMIDTTGIIYMTNRTYFWNDYLTETEVDDALIEYFGGTVVRTVDYVGYPYPPEDGTGHIDMIAKLLDDNTVLVANADGNSTYDQTLDIVAGDFTAWGYDVHRVDCWSSGGTWYTYTNSLVVNDHVLIPEYSGHSSENAAAVTAYQVAMPGITVLAINSDASITYGGSIHCVTQLIPSEDTPATPSATPTTGPPTYTPTSAPTNTPYPTDTPNQTPSVTPTQSTPITPTYTPPPTQTPIPTYTPPATPTKTQIPTYTQTHLPSQTPANTPTNTPTQAPSSQPTATHTPVPDCPVIDLELNKDIYYPNDLFRLTCMVFNYGPEIVADQYIILDVYGSYWFWPNWTSDLDYKQIDLISGYYLSEAIFNFEWPDVGGAADGLIFWGALIDPATSTVICQYDFVEFGYRSD